MDVIQERRDGGKVRRGKVPRKISGKKYERLSGVTGSTLDMIQKVNNVKILSP